jgi:hypothetical protein
LVSAPNPNPGAIYYDITLSGIAAIAADDIWAVGSFADANNKEQTLTEHWDGTSWSIIPSPTAGFLKAVSARSDGTVVAVGYTAAYLPLIYQNAASAPKTATTVAAPNTTLLAPLDAAAVDQFVAAAGKAGQSLSLIGHRPRDVMKLHGRGQVHHDHPLRLHNAAVVGRFHAGHHGGADPATSTGFQVVA